jgi:hypothetical protein
LCGNSVGLQRNEGVLKGSFERRCLLPFICIPARLEKASDLSERYLWEFSPAQRMLQITLPSSEDVVSLLKEAYGREVWPDDRLDRLVADLSRGYFISVDLLELAIFRGIVDQREAGRRVRMIIEHSDRNGKMCYPLHGSNRHFWRRLHELGLIDRNYAIETLKKRFSKALRLHGDEIADMEYFGIISRKDSELLLTELYVNLWVEALVEVESASGVKDSIRHELENIGDELREFRQGLARQSSELKRNALVCKDGVDRLEDLLRPTSMPDGNFCRQAYAPGWLWRYSDANGAAAGWRGRKRSLDESVALLPVLGSGITFPVRFARAISGVTLTQWLYEHRLEGATSFNSLEVFRQVQSKGIRPQKEMDLLLGILGKLQFEYYRDFGAMCELSRLGYYKTPSEERVRYSECSPIVFEEISVPDDFLSWMLKSYVRRTPPEYWSFQAAERAAELGLVTTDVPEKIIRRDLGNLRIGASTALYLDFRIKHRLWELEQKLVCDEMVDANDRIGEVYEKVLNGSKL